MGSQEQETPPRSDARVLMEGGGESLPEPWGALVLGDNKELNKSRARKRKG